MQHAADAAIERKFAAPDCIDRHAGGVRRIFDGKLQVDFHRHVPKKTAFHANESNFVIELPRHIITRANVNIFIRQTLASYRLDGFGL